MQAFGKSLLYMRLQSVIGGDSCCSECEGFSRISNVGHAKIHVTTLVTREIGLSIGERGGSAGEVVAILRLYRVTVSILLAMDGIAGTGDLSFDCAAGEYRRGPNSCAMPASM